MTRLFICGLLSAAAFAATSPSPVRFVRHAVLLQPSGAELQVRENIAVRNAGATTFARGAVRFYVPDSAAALRVFSRSPENAPFEQALVKTGVPGVYQVELAIQPGVTQLDMSYTLPAGSDTKFESRTLQKDVPVRLIAPPGVTLTGDGLTFMGQESKSQASNYSVASTSYSVTIQSATNPARKDRATAEADSPPSQIMPGIYEEVYSILGLAFAALALGFVRLYRMNAQAATAPALHRAQQNVTTGRRIRQDRLQRAWGS